MRVYRRLLDNLRLLYLLKLLLSPFKLANAAGSHLLIEGVKLLLCHLNVKLTVDVVFRMRPQKAHVLLDLHRVGQVLRCQPLARGRTNERL